VRNNKDFYAIELVFIVLWLVIAIGWSVNLYKLVTCDFEAPYKAEIIRGIGLIPPVGAIVGWMDIDGE